MSFEELKTVLAVLIEDETSARVASQRMPVAKT
jgi:hypothetical protein